MKTRVRATSIEAYRNIRNLGKRQWDVYMSIKYLVSACNLDIAEHLGLPINRITPRTNELVEIGFVEEAKRLVTLKTGRRVIFWKVKGAKTFGQVDQGWRAKKKEEQRKDEEEAGQGSFFEGGDSDE